MKNLLFIILELIDKNGWCFKYDGACGTCGMKDVADALIKYDANVILQSFENLDLHDKNIRIHIAELDKLYSFIYRSIPSSGIVKKTGDKRKN